MKHPPAARALSSCNGAYLARRSRCALVQVCNELRWGGVSVGLPIWSFLVDWFVRFLLPLVVLLIAALLYEVVRSTHGRRLSLLDASLIAIFLCAILGLGAWAILEWLPRAHNVPVGKHP
jgi:positive regulator of sigma E activity